MNIVPKTEKNEKCENAKILLRGTFDSDGTSFH